jgi:putative heme iron utilization protein
LKSVQKFNNVETQAIKENLKTMGDVITPEVSQRICAHMNDDHADAVLLYAKAFANVQEATAASMVSIDPQGMDLKVTVPQDTTTVRITFERSLTDSEDAHQTLIAMVRQARSQAPAP